MPTAPSRRSAALPAPAGRSPLAVALACALWIALLPNWPLWRALAALPEMSSLRGAAFLLAFGLAIAATMTALLAVFAWPYLIKPAATLCLVAAAIGAHFMLGYGIVIDPTMMTNVLQTDVRETRDLLSPRLALTLLLLAGPPLFWLWRLQLRPRPPWSQAWRNLATLIGALAIALLLVLAVFADLSATMRNHRTLRYLINPLNSFYALAFLAHEGAAQPTGPLEIVAPDARLAPRPAGVRPPLFMLVVGETARADHFQLNGYARPTNPELSQRGVVSFGDVTSCGTNTAASLPCMFSALGRAAFVAHKGAQENLLDVAQRAGLAVLWLDNQAGCKGVCERVPHAAAGEPAPGMPPPAAGLCHDGECYDEALLAGLDARLAALPAERRARGVLLVLHQMGSHGPAYWLRSPPGRKPFQPECRTNVLQQCDRQAIVNAYDNTIAYTDHVLAGAIDWLGRQSAQYDAALLYVSDHGESLGENNLYLHGLPWNFAPREQKHVPMIAWLAPQAQAELGITIACLAERRDAALSHDNLFHSALGYLGVATEAYRRELDAFAPCRSR
jgi:lipid A ethanolaminephosphotransferase